MASPGKLIVAVVGIAVVAAAGWFGWQQYFADSGEAPAPAVTPAPKPKRPPAPKPAAPSTEAQPRPAAPAVAQADTPANPDQLVDQVMSATGLAMQLETLPEQMVAAVKDGFAAQPQAVRALGPDIERIFAESFTAVGFQRRVRASLRANYDETHLRAVLSAASTPVAKKMTQMELAKPSQAEQTAYFSSLANKPIPLQREALLQRLDRATSATDLGTELALASMRAMALGAAGNNPTAASQIDRAMENQRGALSAEVRKGSIMAMAFAYRNATDAELSEYANLHESDHGKWFSRVVSSAIVAEFKSASGQVGERIAALAKGRQTARAPAPDIAGSAVGPETSSAPPQVDAPAAASRQGSRNRPRDVRSCLELPSTAEIIQCAEKGL
jgi:hypothetical protein